MGKARLDIVHEDEAMRLSLNYQTNETPGSVMIVFAKKNGESFDYEGGISCDLGFDAVSRIVTAIAEGGEMKPVRLADGTAIATRKSGDETVVAAVRNYGKDDELALKVSLSPHEANGIRLALEQTMFFLSFIKGVNP